MENCPSLDSFVHLFSSRDRINEQISARMNKPNTGRGRRLVGLFAARGVTEFFSTEVTLGLRPTWSERVSCAMALVRRLRALDGAGAKALW
jgi:hypothetical protein